MFMSPVEVKFNRVFFTQTDSYLGIDASFRMLVIAHPAKPRPCARALMHDACPW